MTHAVAREFVDFKAGAGGGGRGGHSLAGGGSGSDAPPDDEDARLHSITRVGRPLLRAERAVVPAAKVENYLLDKGNKSGKAKLFERELGFLPTKAHADDVAAQVLEGVVIAVVVDIPKKRGKPTYEVLMKLRGPNGDEKNVATGWKYEGGKPSLVTAYIRRRDNPVG
jgi:hypothetical protein